MRSEIWSPRSTSARFCFRTAPSSAEILVSRSRSAATVGSSVAPSAGLGPRPLSRLSASATRGDLVGDGGEVLAGPDRGAGAIRRGRGSRPSTARTASDGIEGAERAASIFSRAATMVGSGGTGAGLATGCVGVASPAAGAGVPAAAGGAAAALGVAAAGSLSVALCLALSLLLSLRRRAGGLLGAGLGQGKMTGRARDQKGRGRLHLHIEPPRRRSCRPKAAASWRMGDKGVKVAPNRDKSAGKTRTFAAISSSPGSDEAF